jgi:hypothetical protein
MDFNTIHNTGSVEIEIGNPMRDEYMNLIHQPNHQFNTIHNRGSVEIEIGNPMRDEYMNLIHQPKHQQDYTMNPANFRPGAYHEKPGQSSAPTSNRNSTNSYNQQQGVPPVSPSQYDPSQYFHRSQYGGFDTGEIDASASQYPFQNPAEQQHSQHHQYQSQQQHQQEQRYSHNSRNSHNSHSDPHPPAEGGPIAAVTSDGVNDDDSFYDVDPNEN